jgi:hypothetical protein
LIIVNFTDKNKFFPSVQPEMSCQAKSMKKEGINQFIIYFL